MCGSAGESQSYKNVIYKNSLKAFGLAWVERQGGGHNLFQIYKNMVANTKDKKIKCFAYPQSSELEVMDVNCIK